MKYDFAAPRNPGDFLYRLNGPHFVVCVHDGDEDSSGCYSSFNIRSLHQTRFINRQIRDIKPVLLQKSAHFKDSGVLDLAGNNVIAFGLKSKSGSDYRVIIGFGAAAGEYDFLRFAIEQQKPLVRGL